MSKFRNFYSIRHRISYGTLTLEYHKISDILKKQNDFEITIDRKLKKLQKMGIDSDTCLEYLECMIEEYITGLLNDLEKKRVENVNLIENLFRKRASDKIELQELLEYIEEEIEETKTRFVLIKEIYEKMDPLENGKLKASGILSDFAKEMIDDNEKIN